MLYRRHIKRLPNPLFLKDVRCQKLVRRTVRHNTPLAHHDNSVHVAVKGVLQTMLDNHNGGLFLFLYLINQVNGPLACGRIQIG